MHSRVRPTWRNRTHPLDIAMVRRHNPRAPGVAGISHCLCCVEHVLVPSAAFFHAC
jgi:hypothetical protein